MIKYRNEKILDVLSKIGGFIKFLGYFAKFIRKIYKKIQIDDLVNELSEFDQSVEFTKDVMFDKDYLTNIKASSNDMKIKIWNSTTGDCLRTLSGHTTFVTCLVKINESTIASGSSDETIKIWNSTTGNCVRTLSGHTEIVSCLI